MNREKRFITYLSISAAIILIIIVLIPLQIKTIFVLKTKIKNLKNNLTQTNQDINYRQSIIADIEKTKKGIVILKNKIITPKDIPSVQAVISSQAKDNNLQIIELDASIQKAVAQGSFSCLPIEIKLKGGFHNLGGFFNELEKSDYSLIAKKLSVLSFQPQNEINLEFQILIKD